MEMRKESRLKRRRNMMTLVVTRMGARERKVDGAVGAAGYGMIDGSGSFQ